MSGSSHGKVQLQRSHGIVGGFICSHCGGRIELYATELGNCTRCGREWYCQRSGGQGIMRPVIDHRRDLT